MQLSDVEGRVERFLTEFLGPVDRDRHGHHTFAVGTARIWVYVEEQGGHAIVKIDSPLVLGVEPSAELFRYVATENNYIFGKLRVAEYAAEWNLILSYGLLADCLDRVELEMAVGAVADLADRWDDALVARFGGRVFHPG